MSFNQDEGTYLRLLRDLAIIRHYLSSGDLEWLAHNQEPQNPFHVLYLAEVDSESRFAFSQGFDQLLSRNQIRWKNLREPIIDLANQARIIRQHRDEARDETAPLPELSKIAIAFSGHFRKRLSKFFLPPSLECARRGPALFAGRLLQENARVAAISADEWLTMPPSFFTVVGDIAIFYICTHGRVHKSQYEAALHDRFWQPSSSDFGAHGPTVLVLDTCHGADINPPFQKFWEAALLGTSVRLLLASQGTIATDVVSTVRGYAFADNLAQPDTSIADAWLRAVRSTSSTGTSHPVAIGSGDSPTDAQSMLSLTFHQLRSAATRPGALSATGPVYLADRH